MKLRPTSITLTATAVIFVLVSLMAPNGATQVRVSPPARQAPVGHTWVFVPDYSAKAGIVKEPSHLGIGTPQEQIRKVSKQMGAAPATVMNPDDGIKRAGDKTYYGSGDDNRIAIYHIPDTEGRQTAAAVASLAIESEAEIPARGICTAFLISNDTAMTAAHCINYVDYKIKVLRFNDQYVAAGRLGLLDVYAIESVQTWDFSHDFAVIKIKPNAQGLLPGAKYKPLTLRKLKISPGEKLYLIGHAAYDVKKYAGNCKVVVATYLHPVGKHTFGCDCTAFGGNSGAPIFDEESHTVVGVLWGGQRDTRVIPVADVRNHEFVSPVWRIAESKGFDSGSWPSEIQFVAFDGGTRRTAQANGQ